MGSHRVVLRAVLALAALAAVLAACGGGGDARDDSGRDAARAAGTPHDDDGAVRLTAIGDSLTGSDGDLAGSTFGPGTWLPHVIGDGVAWAGGWAVPGATTEVMLANAEPVPEADVVVILAGTNDIGIGVPFEETAQNIAGIAEAVGAPRVIVSSVPPLEWDPGLASDYNGRLEDLAAEHGWEFVDASSGVRDGDGWAPGMTDDGVHATEEGYRVIGQALRAAVLG